jgi:hypothetical protein
MVLEVMQYLFLDDGVRLAMTAHTFREMSVRASWQLSQVPRHFQHVLHQDDSSDSFSRKCAHDFSDSFNRTRLRNRKNTPIGRCQPYEGAFFSWVKKQCFGYLKCDDESCDSEKDVSSSHPTTLKMQNWWAASDSDSDDDGELPPPPATLPEYLSSPVATAPSAKPPGMGMIPIASNRPHNRKIWTTTDSCFVVEGNRQCGDSFPFSTLFRGVIIIIIIISKSILCKYLFLFSHEDMISFSSLLSCLFIIIFSYLFFQ